jgi:serine/threonine-protein kinase
MSVVKPHVRALDSQAWHELERVVERFERAWQAGSRPALDDYLPANATMRGPLLVELSHADLEWRLRAGEQARAEDYLSKYPELREDTASALDLIRTEYRIRAELGPHPLLEEYLHRFPQYSAQLKTHLQEQAEQGTTAPAGGHTSPDAWLARRYVPEIPTPSAGETPRVRLRQPQDEADPPLITPSSRLPESAGRCAIVGEIGHGGMGAVLRGHDPELGRDLAVKVLLEKFKDEPDLVRRFLMEAQVGGQLQHPGIVPVFDVGVLADRRPYFTMKLVRGRTLAVLLAERRPPHPTLSPTAGGEGRVRGPAEDLPRFLTIFEQVCQTLAYAHARGVIHRDLKPANVMVGAFGEVQVMDWGLAKVPGSASGPQATGADADTVSDSSSGSVVGTPAYMAPEQARGEMGRIDERCDVFGLGAMLCEILTGQPPYVAQSRGDLFLLAEQARLADAFRRLDSCGADGDLLNLAKACLALQPDDRPRDAGVVARLVTAYLAGVQERLRLAEVERASAQAKAEEAKAKAAAERRARRLTVVLAAAGLAIVLLGGGGWVWMQQEKLARAAETERLVNAQLVEAIERGERARAAATDLAKWESAVAAGEQAEALATAGEASPDLLERVRTLLADLRNESDAARSAADERVANQRMLRRLGDNRLRLPRTDSGVQEAAYMEIEFRNAFRDFGIDVEVLDPAEAAALIRRRAIREELAAALDEWAIYRRIYGPKESEAWQRLFAVAQAADPDPWRDRFRTAFAQPTRQALEQLAAEAKTQSVPVRSLTILATALAGRDAIPEAIALLHHVESLHPDDFWVNQKLGFYYQKLQPPRWSGALRYFTVTRALHPEIAFTHINVGTALWNQGARDAALAAYQEALRLKPNLAPAHFNLGTAWLETGELDKAIAAFEEAIRHEPNYVPAHYNLGLSLEKRDKPVEAIAAYQKALAIQPDLPRAHAALGDAFRKQKLLREAADSYGEAVRWEPQNADYRRRLGITLAERGLWDQAIAEMERASCLDPGVARDHYNVGFALERKAEWDKAIAAYQEAIRLNPDYAQAHCNLGNAFRAKGRFKEALDAVRRGHELGQKQRDWRFPSADWVRQAERLVALDDQLPAVLRGEKKLDARGMLEFAGLCSTKKLHAATARFYHDAFAAEPSLANNLQAGHRYNGACAAALAAASEGSDSAALDEPTRARWRKQALEWLKADLRARTRALVGGSSRNRAAIGKVLQDWQRDPDLASVRDPAAVAKLPEADREAWNKLWADVAALLEQAP